MARDAPPDLSANRQAKGVPYLAIESSATNFVKGCLWMAQRSKRCPAAGRPMFALPRPRAYPPTGGSTL
jgi:hypothetical protein